MLLAHDKQMINNEYVYILPDYAPRESMIINSSSDVKCLYTAVQYEPQLQAKLRAENAQSYQIVLIAKMFIIRLEEIG